MTNISVIEGDITKTPADALLTVVNSGGMWFGGIDSAIQRAAGNAFHSQILRHQPLRDGDAIYATGPTESGPFKDVIFVIDDLEQPVESLILAGLELAIDRGIPSVSIPTIRTGVMAGVRETREEALSGLAEAVSSYATSDLLEQITIVVYNNAADVRFLQQELGVAV